VNKILEEIDSLNKPSILVFNKIDAFTHKTIDDDDIATEKTKEHYSLDDWKNTWMNELGDNCLFISALEKENMEAFRKRVFEEVKKIHIKRFPYNDYLYYEYDKDGKEL
jgi:GTP-binding protein HflX